MATLYLKFSQLFQIETKRNVTNNYWQMDRTSILGDTIDYMKELLDRIKRMKEEIQVGANQMDLFSIFKELKSNEILVRNTPKVYISFVV